MNIIPFDPSIYLKFQRMQFQVAFVQVQLAFVRFQVAFEQVQLAFVQEIRFVLVHQFRIALLLEVRVLQQTLS